MRLLWLITSGQASSRMELARLLNLPQSTISLRVQTLLSAGVLTEHGEGRSQGGRRPRLLAVNAGFGHVWTADLGSRHARIGALDIAGKLLCTHERELDINGEPEMVLADLALAVRELAKRAEWPGRWLGVAVGLPGPVD